MRVFIVLFCLLVTCHSITFTTYKDRASCPKPDTATSTTVLASKSCVAGTGIYGSSRYQCLEKKVVLTTFTNNPDCGLTPSNNTVITTVDVAAADKCIQLGKGWVFYDCSGTVKSSLSWVVVAAIICVVTRNT